MAARERSRDDTSGRFGSQPLLQPPAAASAHNDIVTATADEVEVTFGRDGSGNWKHSLTAARFAGENELADSCDAAVYLLDKGWFAPGEIQEALDAVREWSGDPEDVREITLEDPPDRDPRMWLAALAGVTRMPGMRAPGAMIRWALTGFLYRDPSPFEVLPAEFWSQAEEVLRDADPVGCRHLDSADWDGEDRNVVAYAFWEQLRGGAHGWVWCPERRCLVDPETGEPAG
ncbi:MAG: hypothetical protein F4Z31_01715 [Gemmatimonadetes bacterium]|nr:hypothetical protein [Gemmatimonadota bacterium]